jgi:hypothetical protein
MNVGGPGGADGGRDKQPDDEDDDFEDEVRILFELRGERVVRCVVKCNTID